MAEHAYDVIVVGGALAGCTAATLYGQAGLKVALLERNPDPAAYKQFCTHFIQASATPTLRRLGVASDIEGAGGVRNAVNIWSRWGWIFEPPMVDGDGAPIFGYNIRRQALDPILRDLARRTPGVSLLLGHSVSEIVWDGDRASGVVAVANGMPKTLRARLVVAADGRNSHLAELAGIPAKTSPNRRSGLVAQYRNLGLRHGSASQMWLNGARVGYIFPNEHGVTVVAAMPPQEEFAGFKQNPARSLEDYMQAFADAPDFSAAERISDVIQIKDYPNQRRAVVAKGMALVGDAALSMDPLYGVGCGWAFQTAEWLVDATAPALQSGADLDRALKAYAMRHRKQLGGHEFVIADFSKRYDFNLIERIMFRAASRDSEMAEHFFRFGMRIASLGEFLAPKAVLRAIWVNLTPRAAGALQPVG